MVELTVRKVSYYKWAYPVDLEKFPDLGDSWQTLHDFMNFGNIQKIPITRLSSFSPQFVIEKMLNILKI